MNKRLCYCFDLTLLVFTRGQHTKYRTHAWGKNTCPPARLRVSLNHCLPIGSQWIAIALLCSKYDPRSTAHWDRRPFFWVRWKASWRSGHLGCISKDEGEMHKKKTVKGAFGAEGNAHGPASTSLLGTEALQDMAVTSWKRKDRFKLYFWFLNPV